ncbi:hypothetical protein DM01DRAFT_1404063 [Hesseltinella vesiculosa]|uniref:Uncharacterized protein n=1 Tax=Hesseltinella vesiculosa TaxID=101127 RepID=A0A1X2GWJ9_9FUNG|nr:hypothetical protein DM01DRAFT_1404063 [Hesseltinella vesiculosa]
MKLSKLFTPNPSNAPVPSAYPTRSLSEKQYKQARVLEQAEKELLAYHSEIMLHTLPPHFNTAHPLPYRMKANGAIVMNRKPSLPTEWPRNDDDATLLTSDPADQKNRTSPLPADDFLTSIPLRVPAHRRPNGPSTSFAPAINRSSSLPSLATAHPPVKHDVSTAVSTERKLTILLDELDAVQEQGNAMYRKCQELEQAQRQLQEQLRQRDLVISSLRNHIQQCRPPKHE